MENNSEFNVYDHHDMFEDMVASIEEEAVKYILKAQIRENLQREEVVKNTQAVSGGSEEKKKWSRIC